MVWAHFRIWLRGAVLGVAVLGMMAVAQRDNAVVVDSGSTNTAGYRIEVWSDGSATLTIERGGAASQSAAKPFTVAAATVARFFADLAAARKSGADTVPCMKSASFGTTLRVTWQEWVSPDLTCPPKDSVGAALIGDVEAIRKASGLGAPPMRQGPVLMGSPAPPEPRG